MTISVENKTETKMIYTCSEHGVLTESICRYCDKCPHGVSSYGHCEKCNDFDWLNAQVNRAEFQDLVKSCAYFGGPYRRSPYPRQFVTTSILQLVLNEFRILKGW